MNAKQLIAAMAVLAATGSAFAGDINPFPDQEQFVSKKTRAEVQAELAQAKAQGLITWGEEPNYPVSAPIRSTRSREEVRKEAIQEARHHKFNPDYDSN